MLSFLFWNLMGGYRPERHASLRARLARLADTLDVDLFLFAEPIGSASEMEVVLSQGRGGSYRDAPSLNARIQVLSRLSPTSLVNQYDSIDGRLTIRRLLLPVGEILLAILHFQSQLHWTPDEQALQATVIRDEITRTEELVGHRRTLLVGDLNMNPFDAGLVGAHGLNAVMARQVARAGERSVAGRKYRFFYNPMWGYFGDRTPGPAGTYYHGSSSPISYYWNMFDQALLRPELMDSLVELRILDTDGETLLLTPEGRPSVSTASDHLPLLVRLDLNVQKVTS